ncbi:hypothetical protein LTR02_001031 [Friedmanniomyces endolithicus]|nr:hypothetical protein LTR94_001658 [Friedmanniomyces endolithicus]KAK0793059.1 hypothetical protein LTR75_011291 [Friedmanniomyces endolithicus]KAK0800853.1 hypothetical protein LTR38_007019 [Friedmanniomyces endolithicus]KAK0808075.1 hypothetical protein LTR59_003134 [Friedmanniomyces endolithicus]KAK0827222.1 hypothetical protein LTR03_016942 [Friedmanniomyces endolithicus]
MRNHMRAGWFYSPSQIARYFPSRITSLFNFPRLEFKDPIRILRQLNRHQWNMFAVGFAAWAWDAFDFFTVSLTVTELSVAFNKQPSEVSWGITVTLMLRCVGALISGSFGDRYGRKWIMIANLTAFIFLELGSGFCQNLNQFLAVRSLYGIAMGGLLGPAAATALEDLPYDARGILSGLFQQAYGVGYLLAAVFYRALVPTTTHGWRSLFWFGAGPPILIILWRLSLPETNHFLVSKSEREAREAQHHDEQKGSPLKAFLKLANSAMRENWMLFVYMVVLMAGFNSISHGTQDLYPTFLKSQLGFSPTQATVVTVVGQLGAISGGMTVGWLSTFTGRRLAMMVACLLGGALVPPYVLLRNNDLIASAFFEQFFVGGVWGPIPVYLVELSPAVLRTFVYGLSYQLGNLASSASSTIEATIGERFPLAPTKAGVKRYDYGKVLGIYAGAVWAYILLFVFLGPEMTQDERNEEAALVLQFEELRAQGVSLLDIGAGRAKNIDESFEEKVEEKGHVQQIEERTV